MPRSALAVLCVLFSAVHLAAATLERLTLNEMIEKSTSIVRGPVVASYTGMRGSLVYTYFKIRILEQWKGPQSGSVEIMVPGGVGPGIRQSFSGVPRLVNGKEYLLYLWKGPSGATQVTGFAQGVFSVSKNSSGETQVVRAASTEMMVEPGTERMVQDAPMTMPLREMSARISSVLGKGGSH